MRDYAKTAQPVSRIFGGKVGHGVRRNLLDFGVDSVKDAHLETFFVCFYS